jgi:hypothetical protein
MRNWLKPTLVALGLVAALSGCVAYVGPGGGGGRWHEHYYYR